MSGKLPASSSLEFISDHIQGVLGGLDAEPTLASEIPKWETLATTADAETTTRNAARRKLARSRRHTRVLDARWDFALTKLSGRAYEASDKQATHEPYASLFGSIAAKDATGLGADRALAFGDKLLEKLDFLRHPDLLDKTEAFREANSLLRASVLDRDAAELATAALDVKRVALRQAVEKQAAATEIAVLTVYPGRGDLVSALLSPDKPEPAGKAAAAPVAVPEPAPVVDPGTHG